MKKLSKIVSLIAISAVILSSCGKKYPDGGKIKKATENIQGTWTLDAYLVNGTDKTSELIISGMKEVYYEGATEGEGTLSRSYTDEDSDFQSQDGNYKFDTEFTQMDVDGIGSIELTAGAGTTSTSTYDILQLDDSELRYSFENGGDSHELRFVKN